MEKKLPERKNMRLRKFDYGKHGAYFITICTEGKRCILSEVVCEGEIGDGDFHGFDVGDGVLDVPPTKLYRCGEIAEKYIRQLSDFYDDISVEHYVIMPNHIHLILFVDNVETIERLVGSREVVETVENGGMVSSREAFDAVEQCGMSRTPSPTVKNESSIESREEFENCCANYRQNSTVSRFVSTFKRFCNKECGRNIWQRSFYDHVIRNQQDYNVIVKYIYENPMKWKFDKLYREGLVELD